MNIPDFPNDRDYFFDENDDIYQVLGYKHPKNAVLCLKKYECIPSQGSTTNKANTEGFSRKHTNTIKIQTDQMDLDWYSKVTQLHYRRIITSYSSKTAMKNIENHPYSKYCSFYGSDFIEMPASKIKNYLIPQKGLIDLNEAISKDRVKAIQELKTQEISSVEFSFLLQDVISIPEEDIGVTGSILWGGVHQFSDIDVIIYGIKNTNNFIRNSMKLTAENPRIRRPSLTEINSLANKMVLKTGLNFDDCFIYSGKKPYLFYFGKYFLSIAFCPLPDEIKKIKLLGEGIEVKNIPELVNVTIQATIDDLDLAYFYIGLVGISDVKMTKIGDNDVNILKIDDNRRKLTKDMNIFRILIFERDISGYFNKGQRVEIRGLIQQVIQGNEIFYQIVIGTAENYGNEYIKIINANNRV